MLKIKNILFLLFFSSLFFTNEEVALNNEELIIRDFMPSGRIDAMINENSEDLKLIQLDLKNDSLYQIANSFFPELEFRTESFVLIVPE